MEEVPFLFHITINVATQYLMVWAVDYEAACAKVFSEYPAVEIRDCNLQ